MTWLIGILSAILVAISAFFGGRWRGRKEIRKDATADRALRDARIGEGDARIEHRAEMIKNKIEAEAEAERANPPPASTMARRLLGRLRKE